MISFLQKREERKRDGIRLLVLLTKRLVDRKWTALHIILIVLLESTMTLKGNKNERWRGGEASGDIRACMNGRDQLIPLTCLPTKAESYSRSLPASSHLYQWTSKTFYQSQYWLQLRLFFFFLFSFILCFVFHTSSTHRWRQMCSYLHVTRARVRRTDQRLSCTCTQMVPNPSLSLPCRIRDGDYLRGLESLQHLNHFINVISHRIDVYKATL